MQCIVAALCMSDSKHMMWISCCHAHAGCVGLWSIQQSVCGLPADFSPYPSSSSGFFYLQLLFCFSSNIRCLSFHTGVIVISKIWIWDDPLLIFTCFTICPLTFIFNYQILQMASSSVKAWSSACDGCNPTVRFWLWAAPPAGHMVNVHLLSWGLKDGEHMTTGLLPTIIWTWAVE